MQGQVVREPIPVRATLWIVSSTAGFAAAITLLYLGMRAVMGVGGFCAEGGAFEIRVPCPKGIPGVMLGGIWGGIAMTAIYVAQVLKNRVPHFIGLLWPALFLSLGWNFIEFGFDPPGDFPGWAWSWLICGVIFILMGGAPLVVSLPFTIRQFTRAPTPPPRGRVGPIESTASTLKKVRRVGRPKTWPRDATPDEDEDLVTLLERLAVLHRSGALSDEEYEEAKRKLLRERS